MTYLLDLQIDGTHAIFILTDVILIFFESQTPTPAHASSSTSMARAMEIAVKKQHISYVFYTLSKTQ